MNKEANKKDFYDYVKERHEEDIKQMKKEAIKEIEESRKEIKEGKGKLLKSLEDLR